MNVTIKKCHLNGKISAPPSKSYCHRYLIASMLSKSQCIVENVYLSEDIQTTLNCLKELGCSISFVNNQVTLSPLLPNSQNHLLDCHESGSTLRFLIPIALTMFDKVEFTGTKRLMERGIEIYEELLPKHGVVLTKDQHKIILSGKLKAGDYVIPGDISSQFITGLLFALPLLKENSTITIIPPIKSIFYIHMTLNVLKQFKITYELEGEKIKILGNQQYQAVNCKVEGDYSNAAFLEAFNYFNHHIVLEGLNALNTQGDRVYQLYFNILNDHYAVLDISNAIDLGPVLFVFAALKHGATFTGTKRLKIKESHRDQAIAEELRKIGIKMKVEENKVKIFPSKIHAPVEFFESHNDHRIVMALSLISSFFDIKIKNASAINKSYPNYFDDLMKLGAEIDYENE